MPNSRKKLLSLSLTIVAIIILCIVLNLFALSRLKIDTSQESIKSIISNTTLKGTLAETKVNTAVTLQNPSILPAYATGLEYYLSYGDLSIGNGTTGSFFLPPNSEKQVQAELQIDNVNAAKALIGGIIGLFGGEQKGLNSDYSVSFGPIKLGINP